MHEKHNSTERKIKIISEFDENRVDTLIESKVSELSRSRIHKLILEGLVTVNGKKVKKSRKINAGDSIEIIIEDQHIDIKKSNIAVDVILEDENIIIINKPSNMSSHCSQSNMENTVVNSLLGMGKSLFNAGDPLRPGVVHRLDKNTTGAMVLAKNAESYFDLIDQFSNRYANKIYIAIVSGKPKDTGIISENIARSNIDRKKFHVSENGKEAISIYKLIKFDRKLNISLVMVKILTGRTHQIRVHMAHIKHPILGDDVYGSKKVNNKLDHHEQLLHALKIEFKCQNKQYKVIAELQDKFKKLLNSTELSIGFNDLIDFNV